MRETRHLRPALVAPQVLALLSKCQCYVIILRITLLYKASVIPLLPGKLFTCWQNCCILWNLTNCCAVMTPATVCFLGNWPTWQLTLFLDFPTELYVTSNIKWDDKPHNWPTDAHRWHTPATMPHTFSKTKNRAITNNVGHIFFHYDSYSKHLCLVHKECNNPDTDFEQIKHQGGRSCAKARKDFAEKFWLGRKF